MVELGHHYGTSSLLPRKERWTPIIDRTYIMWPIKHVSSLSTFVNFNSYDCVKAAAARRMVGRAGESTYLRVKDVIMLALETSGAPIERPNLLSQKAVARQSAYVRTLVPCCN